jgi:trimethylamine-N-oxide reductase (cytochrome c)
MASNISYWFTRLGIKSIYICPDLNYGAAVHADKWIPIRPNTDAALQLAIAHTWITEGSYDKEYVKTHTYGFDKFAEYVMGKEDGIPKTPSWASDKCGIPEWTIKALAREWGVKTTSIMHGNGGAGIRSAYSTEQARLEVILLAMQGLGKPGRHQAKMLEWGMSARQGPKLCPIPGGEIIPKMPLIQYISSGFNSMRSQKEGSLSELEKLTTPAPMKPTQFIPKDLIHDAILNAPISWYGNSTFTGPLEDQFVKLYLSG